MKGFANRADFERSITSLPSRETFEFAVERGSDGSGPRRIRGVANSFKVMRSGRMLHPKGAADSLARRVATPMPLLAQHGYVPGFSTIGTVTSLKLDSKRGLLFEATLSEGNEWAEQAWSLIQQGHLRQLSVGWTSRHARWITVDDQDIDQHVKESLTEAGVREAYVFMAYDFIEVSVVDVPDDPNAVMGARAGANGSHDIAALDARIGRIEAAISKMSDQFGAFLEQWGAAAIDHMETVLVNFVEADEYGAALLDADTDVGAGECRAHGTIGKSVAAIQRLRDTIAGIPTGLEGVRRNLETWGKKTE